MDFTEYQRLASRTATYLQDDQIFRMMYLSMGLAGESGEVIEKVKKIVRNDKGAISDEKREAIRNELGDVLWYISELARAFDIPLEQVVQANIQKITDRAARGVIESEGDNR